MALHITVCAEANRDPRKHTNMGCGASKSVEPTKQVGAGGGGSSTKSTTTVDSAVPPHSLGAAVDPGVGGGSQTSRPRDPDIPAVPKSNPPAAEERASKAREAAGDANDVEQREEAPRSNGVLLVHNDSVVSFFFRLYCMHGCY